MKTFQKTVRDWAVDTFGQEIADDRLERCDRFIEESLELIQSINYSAERAHALVDYVFGRPLGDPDQELGGTMVTLAALSEAIGLDMMDAGKREAERCELLKDKIRAKQQAKPRGSALPQ